MKKRILSILLAFALLSTLLPQPVLVASAEVYSGNCGAEGDGSNLRWTFDNETGILTITGSGTMAAGAPWYDYRYSIQSVSLPDGLKNIGRTAFSGCSSLTSVTIPDSVTNIGDSAFSSCINLKTVIIGDGVTSIEYATFSSCYNLNTVTLGNNVVSIGDSVFHYCQSLSSVVIPESVTSLGNGVFYECRSLQSITLGSSVREIKKNSFYNCSSLRSITIPSSVESIASNAFCGCTGLSSVTIENGLERIESGAFTACSNLPSVTIPASVTYISGAAFNTNIDIIVDPTNSNYSSDSKGALFDKEKTRLILCLGRNVGDYTLPNSVITIERMAFYGCRSLTSVTIPDSVTSIGDSALCSCINLKTVIIGDGVTSIEYATFSSCYNLNTVTLGNNVVSIGDSVFHYCQSLGSVLFKGNAPVLGSNVFYQCPNDLILYYIEGKTGWTTPTWNGYPTATWDGNPSVINVTNIANISTNELGIVVYQNKKLSTSDTDDYQLCEGAVIAYDGTQATTDKNGQVTIPVPSGNEVTVFASGCIARTIPVTTLQRNGRINLQRENADAPVISGVWAGLVAVDVDVLNEEHKVDLTLAPNEQINVEITWADGKDKLYLRQNEKTLDLNEFGTVIDWNTFDVSQDIEIIAKDTNGVQISRTLNVSPATTPVPEAFDGFSVGLGKSLAFTLPDSAGLLAGTELGVGLYSNIPVSFEVENGKIYIAIGYENGARWKNGKKTVKDFSKSVKELGESLKKSGKEQYNELVQKWKKQNPFTGGKGSLGFDADFSVIGFGEGYIHPDGSLELIDAGIIVSADGKVSYSFPFVIPIPPGIPAFFETSLSGKASALGNLFINQSAKQFTPNIVIEGKVSLKGGVGVGVKKVASISGGLSGNLEPHWEINFGETNYFRLNASLAAYVKAEVVFLTFEHEFDPITEATWIEYPSNRQANPQSDLKISNFYDTSNYAVPDLSYLNSGSDFRANTYVRKEESQTTFVENSYEYAAPQIVSFSDGTMLTTWIGSDSSGSGIDQLRLFGSFYDGIKWSAPQAVLDDGTADTSPMLRVIGDEAYVVWQNADQPLSTFTSLEEIVPHMDIAVGHYNKAVGTFECTQITNADNVYDMLPTVCGDEANVSVVWTSNTENDCFGNNTANTICSSSLIDGQWSVPVRQYDGLSSIDSMDVAYVDGQLTVAYAMDTDGDLNTSDDLEVFRDGVQLADNELIDSGVQFVNGKLAYFSNGSLIFDGVDTTGDELLPTDRMRFISDQDTLSILYVAQDGLKSTLYMRSYDTQKQHWGAPVAITDDSSGINSFSGTMVGNSLRVLCSCQAIADDAYGKSSLMLLAKPLTTDLELVDVSYDSSTYLEGGDMIFSVDVKNNGAQTVSSYNICVTDSDGKTVGNCYPSSILPGSTNTADCVVHLDEAFQGKCLTVAVLGLDGETNTDNNSLSITLGYDDLSVEQTGWGERSDRETVVYANVVNRGYVQKSNYSVSLRKGSIDGEILASVPGETLAPFDVQAIAFPISDGADVYFITVEQDYDDDNSANDSDYVVLPCLHKNTTEVAAVPASCTEAGTTAGVVCMDCGTVISGCEAIPALGHDWNEPEYFWADDYATCTATRICKNDSSHAETETVSTSFEVTKEATYDEEGETTYTATFENAAFVTQTIAVPTPKMENPDDGLPCDGGDSCPGNKFTDMPAKGHWAHDAIDWAIVKGVTSGTSETTFSPNASCTRAQVVTFLWRAAGSPEPTSTNNPFTDVNGGYYYKAVLWAVEKNITSGTSATAFSPNATCTRAQIVTFLWRFEGSPEPTTTTNPFGDVKPGSYYEKAVLWASENGVTAGTSATTFSPAATCTRAQVVTFLYRDMVK